MTIRNHIIHLLEEHRQEYLSGQEIADMLHVSRNAVCKVMHSLKEEGFKIETLTRKGYRLCDDSDILSVEGIQYYLKNDFQIHLFQEIDSTNNMLKKLTLEDTIQPILVVANHQTAGRGRFHRPFYSPSDTGVYISILANTSCDYADVVHSTIQTAVAIYRVIRDLYSIETEIKWVNDIYYQGKKVGGVLSEAISNFESGQLEALIIGIGLNITTSSFPKELEDIATSLSLPYANRNKLIAHIADALIRIQKEDIKSVMDEYRRISSVLHKEISFVQNAQHYCGYVKEIDDDGHLIVDCDGCTHTLVSGEVSLRSDHGR